jgi:hypothetical protein
MHFGKQMTTNQQNGGFGSMDRYCKRMQILAGKRSQGIWFKFIIFILKFTYSCVFLPIFGAHFPRIHHYFAPLKQVWNLFFPEIVRLRLRLVARGIKRPTSIVTGHCLWWYSWTGIEHKLKRFFCGMGWLMYKTNTDFQHVTFQFSKCTIYLFYLLVSPNYNTQNYNKNKNNIHDYRQGDRNSVSQLLRARN